MEPTLKNPYLICGLPDVGFVAKQAIDYLIEKLDAKLFEEIYSYHFPSYVLIKKDGTVELMKNELYFWKNDKQENDLIFLTGNCQALSPEGQYELTEEVLTRVEKLGVKKVFTLAAYLVDKRSQTEKPKVYGIITDPVLEKTLTNFDVPLLSRGGIKGFNGLILGMAKLRKMEGICLLSETIGYVTPSGQSLVDVKAAQAILEVLTRILGIELDLSDLEKKTKITEEYIKKIEEMERQTLEQISRSFSQRKQTYYI